MKSTRDGVRKTELSNNGKKRKKKVVQLNVPVNKDDYVIVLSGKKAVLCFAHNPQRNTAYVAASLDTDEPVAIEYDNTTLVANLGQKPKFGKAYGADIEPKLSEFKSEIGKVCLYRELDDTEKKAVTSAIRMVHKRFKQKGLVDIFPVSVTNIRNPKGKWAGSYKVSFKDGEVHDTIQLHPKILEDAKYNLYIFAHELGHAIWYKKLNDRYRSMWLELYTKGIKIDHAKKPVMTQIFQSLVESQLTVRDFMKDIEEDELKLFKEALAYLKKHHKLTPEEINLMLNNDSRQLATIWPEYGTTSSIESLVSEYAATSVHELFAECVGFYFSGKQIPKSAKSLLERTLKFAAT